MGPVLGPFTALLLSVSSSLLQCPTGTSRVEFQSKISQQTRLFCQKKVNNRLVRHGPEMVFDKKGRLVETNHYKDGQREKQKTFGPDSGASQKEQRMASELLHNLWRSLLTADLGPWDQQGACSLKKSQWNNFFFQGEDFVLIFSEESCPFRGQVFFKDGQLADWELAYQKPGDSFEVSAKLKVERELDALANQALIKVEILLGRLERQSQKFNFSGSFHILFDGAPSLQGEVTKQNIEAEVVDPPLLESE